MTLDGFLIPAVRLGNVGVRRRDRAIAGAAAHIWTLTAPEGPVPSPRRTAADGSGRCVCEAGERPAEVALLASAIELFSRYGPASVTIRDVARHAGVNHGLVHRHFGAKDDLIAAAIEAGASSLLPGAFAPGGFDIDEVVHVMHRDPTAARLLARTLVDDIPIGSVRRSYPVMRNLLAAGRQAAAASRPPELADPRLAVAAVAAMVSGSALWGSCLREVIGVVGEVERDMAAISRHLLGLGPVTVERSTVG